MKKTFEILNIIATASLFISCCFFTQYATYLGIRIIGIIFLCNLIKDLNKLFYNQK